jgi:nucleoside-diphosphate-sugar epimerase
MRNVLVTGGAGGIGSTLCLKLRNSGNYYYVVAYDNLSNGYIENLKHDDSDRYFCLFEKRDIRSTQVLKDVINKYNIDVIIHLAALTSLPYCESNPVECIDVNVAGTASVLEAAREKGVRVIVASTSAIYENNDRDQAPYKENIPVNPRLMYPLSKKLMEEVVKSYQNNYNLPVTTLRFFNVFGPRQDIHRSSPPLVNYIVREYKNNRPMTFYSDGGQVRDYVHVDDVVSLIELCIENETSIGEIYNLSTGTLTSVNDIIRYAEKAFNTKLDYKFSKAETFWGNYETLHTGRCPLSKETIVKEVNKFALGNPEKAIEQLGWKPNTNIEELMIDTMQKNLVRIK